MTVIQLPEWDGWRIEGEGLSWEVQELVNDKKSEGGKRWKGVKFYSALEYSVGEAYERTLKECGKEFTSLEELVDECHKTKDKLLKAVRRALKDSK